MGRSFVRNLLALVIVAMLLPTGVHGQSPRVACRDACDVSNLPVSCAWMTAKARRCVKRGIKACVARVRQGLDATCEPTDDFPACLGNHNCPFGTLCIDTRCQVVACTPDDPSSCSGDRTCLGGICVVADCRQSDQNCPAGFTCLATDLVSGTCQPGNADRRVCGADEGCSLVSSSNPRCFRGVCGAKKRRRQCQADGDCFKACRKGKAASRLGYCDAAGRCVCANCESDVQCDNRFSCQSGSNPRCRSNGACACLGPSSGGGGQGVCTTFETPVCTPCSIDADCFGFDLCLQSATCG